MLGKGADIYMDCGANGCMVGRKGIYKYYPFVKIVNVWLTGFYK